MNRVERFMIRFVIDHAENPRYSDLALAYLLLPLLIYYIMKWHSQIIEDKLKTSVFKR